MIRRILFTAAAAAAVLSAAPAFAAEHAGKSTTPCSCCSDGSVHDVDHPLREGREQKASADRRSTPAAADELNARNQSFGG